MSSMVSYGELIFDTADQTDQSNQGLHDKLFCHCKQTRKKIRL